MAKAKDRTSGVSAQQGAAENQQQPTGQPAHTPAAKTWRINAAVRGGKYLGEVMAATREEAERLARELVNEHGWVDLCHQCSSECENAEIGEIDVSADDDIQPVSPEKMIERAAPDLLAACEALMAARLSVFDGGIVEQTEAERAAEKLAEQAIAKATGKAGCQ